MPVFSLYLSTSTPTQYSTYAPTTVVADGTGLGNYATWFINWDELFGIYRTGRMKVRYELQGINSSARVWAGCTGVLRVLNGLSSDSQLSYNGITLGFLGNYTGTLPSTNSYIYGNTTDSLGVECNIPKGYQNFTLALMQPTEAQFLQIQPWNVMLYFEVDDKTELVGEK